MIGGKVRFKFQKTGKLKFISHLDLIRTLTGVLIRANVPLKYSEGFNPHPKMVFSLPLPVGAESLCEYLDVTLVKECDENELIESINSETTPDLHFSEVYEQEMSFLDIAGAEYDYAFYDLEKEELEKALGGALPIEKHSKKGMITVDLRPKITGFTIENSEDHIAFHAFLGAESGDFVNPELLVRAIEKSLCKPVEDYSIMRKALYTADGTPFR